jgi:hypothetical protein
MPKKFKWRKAKPMKDQKPPKQEDAKGQEKSTNTHAYIEGGIEINLGQDLKQQHKTEHDETTTQNKWQLTGTFITAGLVLIYTLITLWQGYQTREIINNTQAQFREQQRPYIWQASAEWQSPGNPSKKNVSFERRGGLILATTVCRNYGASPAITVRYTGDAEIGPNALKELRVRPWTKLQTVMPAGRDDEFLVVGVDDPTSASPEAASYIRIQYKDTGGHLFESDWCVYVNDVNTPGMMRYCPPELNRTRMIDCEKETCEK